ncbi:MAG TPA: hypothetical protein VMV93_06135 [Chloroflexota bacterium]|nr:hypothetical protein [Chloroflexota bacterium]
MTLRRARWALSWQVSVARGVGDLLLFGIALLTCTSDFNPTTHRCSQRAEVTASA